jgi:hypothetical protein
MIYVNFSKVKNFDQAWMIQILEKCVQKILGSIVQRGGFQLTWNRKWSFKIKSLKEQRFPHFLVDDNPAFVEYENGRLNLNHISSIKINHSYSH